MTRQIARHTFVDPDDGWTAIVETYNKLGPQVLKMCRTLDDVRRCADMGDFRVLEAGPPEAGLI